LFERSNFKAGCSLRFSLTNCKLSVSVILFSSLSNKERVIRYSRSSIRMCESEGADRLSPRSVLAKSDEVMALS